MGDLSPQQLDGLGLAEAIVLLRNDLLRARTDGANSDIQLPVESMTVQLAITATKSLDGKAAFRIPFAGVEIGGGSARERASNQVVTLVFGAPVDRDGRPVKIARAASERKS